MMRASPRPVKPRPTRRLAAASAACSGSGQTVADRTLSSMRTAVVTVAAKVSTSNSAVGVNAPRT